MRAFIYYCDVLLVPVYVHDHKYYQHASSKLTPQIYYKNMFQNITV